MSFPPPRQSVRRDWFKSRSSSSTGSCVEVKFDGDRVLIRDSKNRLNSASSPDLEPVITVTAAQWAVFLDEFTLRVAPQAGRALSVETTPGGGTVLRAIEDGTTLTYTAAEWQSFLDGVRAGEFAYPAVLT
ncbi:DUF397 domain-containing protein [Amycolatopsis palatopharyngis]|uniref:DUF397 domain-containing protein n=1 Tax=Amycolatopsis palatopharyngis TaxID=187982 RepID=UPI000E24B062|nr:DUF397 domain-containing protein [Amycolatopsis palatopharyngis]